MGNNKNILFVVIIILNFVFQVESLPAQKLAISPSFGAGFSGFGDILGLYSDVSLIKYSRSKLFLKIAIGISQASQKVYSDDELKNLNNLLIADRWLDNYPYEIYKELFFQGRYQLSPKSNFQNNLFLKLSIGKMISLGEFMDIHLSTGIGVNKFDNTYVTAIKLPSIITNNYGTIDGVLTVNLIDSGILFPVVADVDFTFKLTKSSKLGLYASLSEGYIRYTSAGLRLYSSLN